MNRRRSGCLITFSGLDGAGKSTQINLLMQQLRDKGEKPVYIWSRGGYTTLMEQSKALARRLLRRQLPPLGYSEQRTRTMRKGWIRRLWLTLSILDLMRVYGLRVRWLIWRGYAVICDRYLWDTQIDFRMNFGEDKVEQWWLWRWLTYITPSPDAAFLLMIPVEESLRRSEMKGEPYPSTAVELTDRLHQYEDLAQQGYIRILDGRRAVSDLQHEIQQIVAENLQAVNPQVNNTYAH